MLSLSLSLSHRSIEQLPPLIKKTNPKKGKRKISIWTECNGHVANMILSLSLSLSLI